MDTPVVPFSFIRQSAIKMAENESLLKLVRKTITPKNIIDIFSINTICFYSNKTFGIFYSDFLIVKDFLENHLNIAIPDEHPEFPVDFTTETFENGKDVIQYFKTINMNRDEYDAQRDDKSTKIRHQEVDYSTLNFSQVKNDNILSIDIEVQTQNLNITEVGLTYSSNGHVEVRHFLIEEFKDLKKERKNRQDCFNFGTSELVSIETMKSILIAYLEKADHFMAHSIHSENHYLKQVGINLVEHVDSFIDTQSFHKTLYEASDPISLENLLKGLNIPFSFLHNSGNDAFYTWQAFIHMVTDKVNQFANDSTERLYSFQENSINCVLHY